jgi:hypothetical protein
MAVIKCKRRDTKRGTENDKQRSLIDEYIIQVDSTDDEPSTIYESSFADIPQVGDPHPVDPLVTVKSRAIKHTDNRLWYVMDVSYDNSVDTSGPGGGGGGGGPIEVLQVTVGVWFEDYIQEHILDAQGGKGELLMNTAGSPIKYESRRPHPLITITSQTKDPGLGDLIALVDTVNGQFVNWLGMKFEVDQFLFDSYQATSVGDNTWSENFVFKAKVFQGPVNYDDENNNVNKVNGGWQPFILNAGLWEWKENDQGEQERGPIYPVDRDGNRTSNKPVTEPWPLDKEGFAIPRQDFAQKVHFLKPKMKRRENFAKFNFDFTKILTDDKIKQLGI